ncbi:MAG: ABC transporter substrate-binding protein [Burkholderiales bacterium RIFCSPHIGHO2_01_FULL_64_960]|nr:MAG: ABC transporter substrate-binding protein [Burkholderiales bacterium RIFCSPHIGHO2_01_FULL_64_960]
MSESNNPFIRGYRNLRIIRTLLITYEDDEPPVWRMLHASQAHLPDDQVAQFPCVVGKDFALITEGQEVPPDLEALCTADGIVRSVVYVIEGEDFDGQRMLVGDTYSEEAAREAIQRLSFATGVYSRCWEISSAHITEETGRYLADLADLATPEAFLFIAFRIPYSPAIGVKLISTPWTDENLLQAEGITATQLRQEHRTKGMPDDLAQILELAGQADVRILILDADARVLPGLPLNEP